MWKSTTPVCAIKLTHTKLSLFYTLWNIYYHNNKVQRDVYFILFYYGWYMDEYAKLEVFVIHSNFPMITLVATIVHLMLRRFVVLTWMQNNREVV